MKYDPNKSFGYPVLRPNSNDYINSGFQCRIEFNLDSQNTSQFIINYGFDCSIKEIVSAIESGKAAYWIKVSCRETFFNQIQEVASEGSLVVEGNLLHKTIEITGSIIAKRQFSLFSKKINSEFRYHEFTVEEGQVIAIDEPRNYVVDKECWKPLTSIFEYKPKDDLKPGEFIIDLEGINGNVEILANKEQCLKFQSLQNVQDGKFILLNTVFFLAVLEMVKGITENSDLYEDKKWARVLRAKASSKNIEFTKGQEILQTHRLLERPFEKLVENFFKGDKH